MSPPRVEVVAGVEIAIQFAGFRNVDLFSQGVYQLRLSARGQRSGRAAMPYSVRESPQSANTAVPASLASRKALLPAHILDSTGEFCTPAFRVRYVEEEFVLRPLVHLRADLSFTPPEGEGGAAEALENLVVDVKLMHARSTTTFESTGDVDKLEQQILTKFTVAKTQSVVVRMPLPSVSTFFPITFCESLWHFCYAPMIIHAAPLSIKLLHERGSGAKPSQASSKPQTPRAGTGPGEGEDALSTEPAVRARQQAVVEAGAELAQLLALHLRPGADDANATTTESRAAAAAATTPGDGGSGSSGNPPAARARVEAAFELKVDALLRAALSLKARLAVLTQLSGARQGADAPPKPYREQLADAIRESQRAPDPLDQARGRGAAAAMAGADSSRAPPVVTEERALALPPGVSIVVPQLAPPDAPARPLGATAAEGELAAVEELLIGRVTAGRALAEEELTSLTSRVTLSASARTEPSKWATCAMAVLSELSGQVWPRWQALLDTALCHPDVLLADLSSEYVETLAQRFGESVFRETRLFEQRAYVQQGERGVPTAAMATALRSSAFYKSLPPPTVRDIKWHMDQQPVFFEQRYSSHPNAPPLPPVALQYALSWSAPPPPSAFSARVLKEAKAAAAAGSTAAGGSAARESGDGVHLIVFVHGFHGNSYDLRTMRDHLSLALAGVHKEKMKFLCSAANEEHTAIASFETLGSNLAKEVLEFIRSEDIAQSIHRVSFVTHSFGAVIMRVCLALPDMAHLHPLLYTCCTFSGPHLGTLYNSNGLVEFAIWGLRRWKKAKCLTEIVMKDAKEPADTLLYKLAKTQVLEHFKHVLLVSSCEDRYIPHHSARIQLCDDAIHDPRLGPTFASMVHALLAPLKDVNLLHIEVFFGERPSPKLRAQLDAAIGRAAHISFLDNDAFVQMFVNVYLPYFA